jgi:type I pantothenate kinase
VRDDGHCSSLVKEVASRVKDATQPVMFGISGGVGVGKSTVAALLRQRLEAHGITVAVVGTDAFILPNAELERRGLAMRKGFPESFDTEALKTSLQRLRGGTAVEVPVYSHLAYDRVADRVEVVEPADVIVVEGVNALQPPIVDLLDLSLFVDAAEADMRAWFVERFQSLCQKGATEDTSFYRTFVGWTPEERHAVAEAAWDGVNLVNLREHILPSRDRATYVLRKSRDHTIVALGPAEAVLRAGPA